MPKILETDVGEIEFPDDFTIDQINEWGRTELPNLRERVSKGAIGDLASRFPRDVAVGGSGLMMGLARGWQQMKDYGEVSGLRQMGALAALEAPVGEEHAAIQAANDAADRKAQELEATREQRLQENTLYQFGLETKANAQEFYKTNPLRDSSIPAMLSEGVASLPPLIASGAAGPLAPVVAGLAYGAMAGQQGAEEAIEMGQPEKADEAFLLFAGLGALSEAALGYPIAFLRKVAQARRAGVAPEAFGQAVKSSIRSIGGRTVREGLEGFGRESLQEGTEQLGQNVVAADIVGYDPDRPAMQGVPQAAAIGGVIGGGVGGVGGAAMAIDEARARRAAEAQIPAILRSIEQAQPVVPQFPVTPEQQTAESAGQPIPLNLPEPPPTREEALDSALSILGADFIHLSTQRGMPWPIIREEAINLVNRGSGIEEAINAVRNKYRIPTAEQVRAAKRQQRVDPYFAEGPNVPAPPAAEPPFFRPPAQPATTPQLDPVPESTPNRSTPVPESVPRRRSPAPQPEPERPRFRPPLTTPVPPATIPASEASAGLKALPVGEETGPTTRSGPPPARAEEGARETGIQSPVRENGAQTSLVLKDGTAIVGGRIHAETFAEAEKRGIKTEDLLDSTSAFTRPDGTSWNLQGTPVRVTKILRLDTLPGQPEETPPVVPEAQQKGVAPEETPVRQVPQGEVGGMLGSGEVRRTSSGRETTPFPNVSTGTDRKTLATVKRVDAWLRDNAIAEAKARGDDFNSRMFEHSNPKRLSQADKDSMEEYLFGQQPAVVPGILKPLSPQPEPTETPNAIQIGSPAPLPVQTPPEARQEVAPQIRDAERPAVPQAETPQAQGSVEPERKAAEEQFESNLVIRSRDVVRQSSNPEQAYESLVQLYESMPRLGTRTAQSKTAQAYSTPPPLAFLASRLAGVTPETRSLIVEPTAGNGMLLIGTGPNANIIANELDPNRLKRLIQNFPGSNYSMSDATSQDFFERLNQAKPNHLIMNPPFGGRVEEGGQAKQRFPLINASTSKSDTPSIDLAIALNSLETMAQDGQAVIIIGSKTGTMGPQFSPTPATRAKDYQRPEMLEFFQRFNVTDWFTVGGKLYEKMGAGWPVDVIVIKGKRPTAPSAQGGFPRPWITPPKVYNSWEELKEKLYETPRAQQPAQPPLQPQPEPASRPEPRREPRGPTGGAGGAPLPRPAGGLEGRPTRGTPRVPQEPRTPPAESQPAGSQVREQPAPTTGGTPVVPSSRPEPAPSSSPLSEPSRRGEETGESGAPLGEGSNLLNVPFKPVSKLGGANLVAPRNVADAMSRAVSVLEREVGMSVDDYVAKKLGWTKEQLAKRFSSAQAESVGLFIRNLESRGTGLINSDQTGVGKGRTVAAAIQYALKNGKVPIFITAKKQLYSDMAGRDLPTIGINDFRPFITDSSVQWTNGVGEDVNQTSSAGAQRDKMAEITRTGKLPAGVQGVFTTYDQLKSDIPTGWKETPRARMSRKKKFEPRPDGPRFQMLRKLAPNAIFILDEAHLAAGQDSDVGLLLQSILPSAAGVYYASATFAKRPDNLNLYALGTAMKKANLSRKELGDAFTSGGVPLQQALTSMLTESGEFVRREQNMEGVGFKFKATGTDPEKESELADTYTSFLRDLFQLSSQVQGAAASIVDEENQVRAEGEEVDLSSVNFGARLFNLSSQYLFSLRTDATIQESLAALKADQKPFIAVYNTMAGPIADLQKRGLPINYAGMLEREMQKMLEITIKDPNSPGDPANKVPPGKRKIILKPEDLSDGGRFYYQLLDQIKATDFSQMPISPIDTIKNAIKKAGYTIGELTGRHGEVEDNNESIKVTKREKQERNKVLSDFNNGALDALIVNSSADTGVSAHTDPRFKDQRQRHMIIAQPNPDINGFMQIVGRVMRFGQTKLPSYTIIASSLATERRFNTMLRAKLNSLNANTTADTESGITQSGLTEDIFNAIGDEVVAQVMAQNPELAALALISLPDPTEPGSMEDFARYATGRFVLLPNADADHLWSEIAETYRATIKALDDAGENPLRADVVDLRAKTTKSQTIQQGAGTTLFDGPVVLETADVSPPQPALTAQQAMEIYEQARASAEAKAQDWLSKFEEARRKRLETMRQRDSTDAQIQATDEMFRRTKTAVEEAVRLLGEPVAIKSASGEAIDFYAIPIGLMLKAQNIGDFSGPSKHSLVLATNGLRRQVTLPLSQMSRIESSTLEAFDSERDRSGRRHIVTGNLLRGVRDATQMARGTSRPKVTIYSTSDGKVKTGILMAPGWRPEDGLRALGQVLKTQDELAAALNTGKLITAGPVLIRGNSFSVPSRNEFRIIWGDPQFARLFERSPVERRGAFEGDLTTSGRNQLYQFLRSKGLTPTLQATEESESDTGKYSVTLSEPTGAPAVTPSDIEAAFPAAQGFDVRPVAMTMVEPDGSQRTSNSFLIKLPNGQAILVDPTLETIHFDPTKAAADWGLDPQTVAQRGVARGVYRSNGAALTGLSRVGLIELLNTSDPSTLSHEKFHALFDMALTEEDRAAILDRYKTEEKAAEAFRRSEGFTRTFWEKIRRFIEWLANLVRGDAFRKLRQPLSAEAAQPTGRTEPQYSLETILRDPARFQEFVSRPTISPEEAASLRQQAGAGAGLVPDVIAEEIETLKTAPADTVEGRMATLLDFVLQLHGVAPALDLQRILTDANIPDDTKQAAISNVLRQIEHVRTETDNIEAKLQEANKKLATAIKQGGKITKERLVEARAKQIADNLISRYRQYLTAQAANLPANQNLAAARSELIQGMRARLDRNQTQSPDAMWKAIERIAERISELPVSEGPLAVTEAIRQKGILRDVAGDPTIDLLTAEKPGGLAPLLASPEAGAMLQELADLQKKAAKYAKQIEVIEQAFRGKGEPTPVELKKFADTYRKFRNKQADATKAIREYDKQFREADDDVQVYGRSHEILTRLQQDPQFRAQLETVLARPGGEILSDIYQPAAERKDDLTKETVFLSPLTQKPFRVHLSPTRKADNDTLRDMGNLKNEIDEFLLGENIDPLDRRTWEMRRAYIEQYLLHPQYLQEDAGGSWTNPFQWGRVLFGGLTSSLRAELESLGIRASQEADTQVRVAEQAAIGYKLLANNKEFGDAATAVATIEAVKSHGWPTTRILFWNQNVLNPILASGQTAGQMRLKAGDYIPGTNIQITKQDMIVAGMEKRFSSGIVQTTQGTGKGLPSILRNNPILITDTFSGKPVLRGALSPGPLTMARSFSTWGRQFDVAWAAAGTPEARRRLVNDGENFQMAALGFVRTTNPEFQNDSPLVRVYEQYAKNAKDNNQYSANSFDQLVDHLADIAVAQNRYQTKEQAIPEIEATLMEDIGRHVAAIRAQFAEDKLNPQVHQTVMQYASAQNAFTKARKKMVAPDPYYDYTLTHESDRISFVGAGFQQFQLRIVAALEALQTALGIQQTQWDGEISDLYSRGGTEEEARAKVNKKTIKQIGDVRFSYEQLLDYKRRLDKLIKQLKELVIDVRDPNDSLLLQAVTRFHQTLSSGLLANPTAIGNNLAGGIISAKQVTLRNLGQAQSFYNPKAHARMAGAAVKTLLRIFPGTTAIGKLAKSNLPVVEDLSGWVHDMLLEQIKQEEAAEAFGLRTTADLRNRSRARGELMSTAGQIEYDKPGAVASAVNVLGSLPLVRQTMAQLRDKIPGFFDRWMNTNNANFYRDTVFENLKVRAINAFKAREEIAARTGVPLSKLNDFTREENLLTPKELEMPKYSGYRDSGRLRQLFNTVGSLDKFLLDYYNRWKKAPATEKANVPLFPDEADMGAVLHEIESHENLATAGFTPLSMQGVGQRGLLKKVLFMFRNYPTRMFTQMARLLATDPRDPKGWRTAYGWWSVLAVLIVSAIAGMVGKEIASPIQQAITGRSPSYVKLSNVMANPDAGMVARYVGMALASNLPYYGGVVSQLLGNPGYGTWLDLAEYIPAAGLIKDAGVAVRRMGQTGDAILPGADFVGRWFPPASPALRVLPSVSGDIERRNAERALRVVGPSAGMELAGGGGGNAVQTPASAAVRRLISAAYRGDTDGIRSAFDEAVREKTEAGSPDPERAVLQSLASAVPARRVFGKSITPSEEAQLTGLMSGGQRSNYAEAQNAFDLINQTLGTRLNLTSTPRARTRGQATRRALFADSASPIFATRRSRSRRRRLGGRGRSAFRRLRIRGSSRRRRRSPARFSFAA